MKTYIISGFPGTGKTEFVRNSNKLVLDSDSSKFDKKNFPENYIKYIKSNIGLVDIICVSSHKDVREKLVESGIYFFLVYPEKSLKQEYLERYKKRGDSDSFITLLSDNWDKWLTELENQTECFHIVLKTNEYLSSLLEG